MKQYLFIVVFIIFGGLFVSPSAVDASFDNGPGTAVELEGYAWSAYTNLSTGALEGVGWISFNCSLANTCAADGGFDYKVSVDPSGNMTGYAWSPNVGWIKFGGLSGFPTGTGVAPTNARADGDFTARSYEANPVRFSGWARVCSVFANPNLCSGALNTSAGGWDGWIALGTDGSAAVNYGITMDRFTGATDDSYAWGSDKVVGWIDFNPTGQATVAWFAEDPVIDSFDATTPIGVGTPVTFDYAVNDATSCSITNDIDTTEYSGLPGGPPAPAAPTAQTPVSLFPAADPTPSVDTVYTLTCFNGARTQTQTSAVDVQPDLSVGAHIISAAGLDPITGLYANVNVTFNVSGSMLSGTEFQYTVELIDGVGSPIIPAVTGNLSNDNLASISNVSVDLGPVLYQPDAQYRITVDSDDSVNTYGEIEEIDETNNQITETVGNTLAAPPPTITIIPVSDTVARGEVTQVDITVEAIYPVTCTVFGPIDTPNPAIITVNGVAGGVSVTLPFITDPMTNSANFVVECPVIGGDPYRESDSVTVTAGLQEV